MTFALASSSTRPPSNRRHVHRWAWLLPIVGWLVGSRAAQAEPLHSGPPPIELTAGSPDDPVRLHLGASVWLRGEARHEAPADPTWTIPQRTRLQAEARWRGLTAFVQLQDVRAWGTAASTLSTPATTGLHQGYFEVAGHRGRAEGFVRVGRQEIALGSMRLVGTAPWNPNMRSFDAVRVHGAHGPFSLDLAGALIRAPDRFTIVDDAGVERTIGQPGEGLLTASFGVALHDAARFEAYALLHNQTATADAPTRDRLVLSPGARVWGQPWRGLSYELEGYGQTGRWDGRGHAAWLGAATVGYRWPVALTPVLEGGYVLATGSGCVSTAGGTVCDRDGHRDVDAFFGARHRFLGILDLFAPTNVHEAWAGLRIAPGGWTELRAELRHFMLHDPTGRWLRTNDTVVGTGPDPSNRQRTVGEEIDLRLSLQPWGPLTLQAGYAVFVPTGAGPRVVGEQPLQFGYVLTQLAF